MIKVKFLAIGIQESIEGKINTALAELRQDYAKILDVKFVAREYTSNALILYEEIEKEE